MFANTDEQWKTTQEKMSKLVSSPASCRFNACHLLDSDALGLRLPFSSAKYYGFRRPGTGAPGGSKPPQHAAPDKPVPPGYVCYRCGQPGKHLLTFASC